MSASSQGRYRTTVEYFLRYLGQHHPDIQSLAQLRRDHFLGWFSWLSSQQPPLVKSTRYLHIVTLRRVMEELAWLHEMPVLARLFHPDDIPRFDHRFPRPLSPEQDRLIQEELMRRNDVASNALLLVRYTGIRIGECVDLPLDCLWCAARQPGSCCRFEAQRPACEIGGNSAFKKRVYPIRRLLIETA